MWRDLNLLKANAAWKQKRIDSIEKYNLNPRLCKECGNPISYDKKIMGNIFCSHSCSAKYSNKRRIRKKKYPIVVPVDGKMRKKTNTTGRKCIICGEYTPTSKNIFCEPNGKCDCTYSMNKARNEGRQPTKELIRRYLILTRGYKCENENCGISEWNGVKIPLEAHHKDGNAKNNADENLKLLCPNCHSITDTFRGRNRNKGRGIYKRK